MAEMTGQFLKSFWIFCTSFPPGIFSPALPMVENGNGANHQDILKGFFSRHHFQKFFLNCFANAPLFKEDRYA